MNFLRNFKKIVHTYQKIESPAKKILKIGSLVSLGFMLISGTFYLLYWMKDSYQYLEFAQLFLQNGVQLIVEIILACFIFDVVLQR